ncbi:P-loop containing nucleoside triphosphate hydrolase protein [Jimgerdemannia flammicorona]|uniref:P-loop containing nucleoside triphosphate hydrolase protein n=1 Tax=Jimgerdemannia flammicorona TaxID=994334 RepID=A0A433QSK6_9FUNG|nr:P-loop containing nucleoside triphosphate hydrolase protein [Jimgerdemannia flammicorona]
MNHNQNNRGRGNFRGGGAGRGGRGRGQNTNQTPGGPARQARPSGITPEQKRQIVERRQESIQISSDGTDDLIVAENGSEDIQQLAFVTLGRNSRAFEHQHRMRRFVNSCLVNLSNHHDVDTSGLLIGLVSGPGVARMNDIMLQPMSVDAGLRKWPVSFQYVVLPFVGVLTREKVCQTNMVQQANTIYTAVYVHAEQFLLKGVLRCMQELMDRQSLRDYNVSPEQMRAEDAGACTVTTFPHALLAITRLVFQLLTRVRDAKFEDHFTSIVDQLLHLATRCPQMPPDTAGRAFERDILNREIERINAIILDAKGLTLPAAPDSIIKRKPPGTTANIEFLERNFDPPGDFSPDGPRHDNDQPNIADIQVIPTQAEVTCKRTPFLPANGVPDAPHFIEPGWKRQLDIHFRLFREDMLDPLRKGILAFLRLLEQMTGETRMALSQQGRLRHMVDENVDLNVYCDVHFHGLRLTKQQRVSVEISFAQPKSSTARTADQRKEFWERSKNRLMQGGLICLVWKDTRGRTETATVAPLRMIFGIIIDRDVRQLAVNQDHAIITIALTDPSVYLLMLEAAEQGGGQDVEHFMVESPGVFFESYRPILKALQQCTPVTLPFGRYLAPTAADVVGPNNREDFVEPPLYTRAPGFAFDLSVILEPGQAYNLVTTDKASRALAVTMLQQHSTLDDTQARALVETLCREVALIKGPPGTGKTKIGIDLMRVFLHNANKMQCGPILCICYTNHALDQFLEHLLDQNVKSIVRVGAQSKSERLQDHNLEQLMRSQARSFDTRQAIYEGRTKWDQVSKNLLDIDKSLQTGTLPWKYLGPYLMDYWYDHYRNINNENAFEAEFEDEDDGGGAFQTVGAKNEDGPYHRWISGSDIKRRQEYLEYLRKQKKKARKERKANINRYAELGLDADLNGNYSSMRQQSPEDIAAQAIHIPKTNRPLVLLEVDGNVWNMSLEERRRLSDSWKRPVQENMLDELKRLLEESEKIEQNIKNAYDEMRRVILKKSTVIGMTTNGAAKYQTLVSSVAPRIIVCEEAGEVLESHILATLSSSTQHLILIGDHQQLRPHVATYNLSADSHVGRNYNLDKSLFERLVTAPVNTLPMSILTTQRRMRPEIANLIRNTLYPDLVDGGSALTHPPVGGMKKNLYFMDHNHPEDSKDQFGMQSYSNTFEVRMIEALVKYLIRNGYNKHGDIAVLTPYLGQLAKLRKVLMNSFVLVIDERDQEQLENMDLLTAENEEAERVEQNVVKGMVQKTPLQKQVTLRTIDNYQGEEAKIIIISLVRNLRTQDGAGKGIGFLKSPNRTNVLLSRAQHGMFLLGNANLLARNEAGIWPKIIDQLRETDCVGPGFPILCQKHPDTQNIIDTPEMFRLMAPHGGCNLPCSYNMDCGHVCPCQCKYSHSPFIFVYMSCRIYRIAR